MPHYAVRITHSWLQAQSVAHNWALRADKVLVYEHSQQTKTAKGKTHIHMLLVNTDIDKKQLRNIAKETTVPTKGNENMSFKMAEEPFGIYITYMTKGVLQPVYNKGFDPEELERYRQNWTPPSEYVKETPWTKLYQAYEKEAIPVPTPEERATVMRQWVESASMMNPPSATALYMEQFKKHSYKWIVKYNNGVWNPAISKQLSCIRFTHCWKHNLPLDQTWKL